MPLVACTPPPYTVVQHGLIPAPRAASFDGQPLATSGRIEGYASTARIESKGNTPDSGAAIARHEAGAALRHKVGDSGDIGFEIDGAWAASNETLSGDNSISVGVPDAAVIDAAIALRGSSETGGGWRIGYALAMGLSSCPIHREGTSDGSYDRDSAFLIRAALVPSYRMDKVTLFGSVGGSSQADIQSHFTVVPDSSSSNDPGVVAEAKTVVLTVAAGATFDLGERAHLTAQVADAFGRDATFGPQVTAGISLDLGDPPAPRAPAAPPYTPPPYAQPPVQ